MHQLNDNNIKNSYINVPIEYRNVLRLLREADESGLWPLSSVNRQVVVEKKSLVENGGKGGSFSIGAFPKSYMQPKTNQIFPELMKVIYLFKYIIKHNHNHYILILLFRHVLN